MGVVPSTDRAPNIPVSRRAVARLKHHGSEESELLILRDQPEDPPDCEAFSHQDQFACLSFAILSGKMTIS